MISELKKAFQISFDNLILSTPPLVFIIFNLVYFSLAQNSVKTHYSAILYLVILILTISFFISGWAYMVIVSIFNYKNGISYSKSSDSFKLLKEFPVGVSDYFKKSLTLTVVSLFLWNIVLYSCFLFNMKVFGDLEISIPKLIDSFSSLIALQNFCEHLTQTQILQLTGWTITTIICIVTFGLFTILWPLEIFYKRKKVLDALFVSAKKVSTQPKFILLYLIICFINLIFIFLNIISFVNPIASFFMTLTYFYFIVYIFVLLFLYYEDKIQSYSNSSTDSNRKN